MSDAKKASQPRPARALWKDPHFLIATLILAATAGGWGYAAAIMNVVFQKDPVPWPAAAEVDGDHRLLSLAKTFGPKDRYKRIEADGAFPGRKKDGVPDGEMIFKEDTLEALGVATSWDRTRYASRRSNWYVSRTYVDDGKGARHRLWGLDVTYYTGGLDKVPHVAERCIVASGGSVKGSKAILFDLPRGPAGWTGKIAFQQIDYYRKKEGQDQRFLQYYIFALNGKPVADWKVIRWRLQDPFERYAYFAKVQFGPLEPVRSVSATRRAAERFIREALPEILKALPTPEDVENLSKTN